MTEPTLVPQSAPLPTGRHSGVVTFQQTVRQVFALAVERGWRRLVIADHDFADWPLGERVVTEQLTAFSQQGGQLDLLLVSDRVVRAHHARFMSWRQTWAHRVNCRVFTTTLPRPQCTLIWTPDWALRGAEADSFTTIASEIPSYRAELQSFVDGQLAGGRAALAVSTLGL